MTSPVGSARVEITGDVSSFASDVRSQLQAILASIDLDPVEVTGNFTQAQRNAEDAATGIEDQFEQGAEGSEAALEGVDEDFQEPEANADRASEAIASDFESAGSRASSALSSSARFMAGAILGIAAAATAAAGAVAGISLVQGFRRLTDIENATASLRGLGHEAETIEQIMGDATTAIEGTIIGLPEAAQVAAGAVAAGIEPGRQLEETLRAVGDAATITGADLGEIGSIMNTVAAANTATMGEIQRLQDRGLPILQFLADQYGVTAEEAREMVSSGEVDFENFRQAITDNIGGAALEATDTTEGAFDNMMFTLARIGQGLLSGVFPQFKEVFNGITDLLLPIEDAANSVGGALGEAFEVLGEGGSIGEALATFRESLDPELFQEVTSTIRDMVTNGFQFLGDNAVDIVGILLDVREAIFDALLNGIEAVAEALPEIVPQVVGALVSMIETIVDVMVTAVPQLVVGAAALITGLADGIIAALPQVIEAVGSIVQSIAEFIRDPEGLSAVVNAAVELVGALVDGIIELVTGGELQIAALSIITGLIEASHALVPELVFLGHELVLGLIDGLIESMDRRNEETGRTLIETLVDSIEREVPRLLDSGAEMVQSILEGFLDVMDRVGDTAEQIIGVLSDKFGDDETAEQLSAAAVEVMNLITTALVENIELITTFVTETFIPEFQRLLDENPELIEAGVEILVAIVMGMAQSNHLLTEVLVTELIPTIVVTLLGASAQMIGAGFELMVSFVAGMNRALSGVVAGQLRVIRTSITRFFAGAGNWLIQAGREIISGLWNGLRERWDGVESWLGGLGDRIRDLKGPESVDRALLRDPGRWIMQGLQEGLESERGNLESQIRDITESIRSQFYGREEFTDREWQALMSGGVDAFVALKRRQFAGDPRYDEEFFATERRRAENTLSMGSMGGDGSAMGEHRIVIENLNITPLEGREFSMDDIERELERAGVM